LAVFALEMMIILIELADGGFEVERVEQSLILEFVARLLPQSQEVGALIQRIR